MLVQDDLLEVAYQVAGDRIEGAIYQPSKVARGKAIGALKDEVEAAIKAKYPEASGYAIGQAFDYLQKKAFRISILDKKNRCDGRGLDDLRTLYGKPPCFPARTAPPSSPAVRPRRSPSRRWPLLMKPRKWTPTQVARIRSASSFITTSLPSPSVKRAVSVARIVVKSVTVPSPSVRSPR
jgi:hypothetical protein